MEPSEAIKACEEQNKRPHRCDQCSKGYERLEHLQRHLSTHGSSRPHVCPICGTSFQRSDVLRRHSRSCNGARFKARTAMKTACDSCSKAKRACDSVQPCLRCRRKDIRCVYSSYSQAGSISSTKDDVFWTRSRDAELSAIDESVDFHHDDATFSYTSIDFSDWTNLISDEVMLDELIWPGQEYRTLDSESSLKFLESFTRNKGFVLSFDCGSEADRQLALQTFRDASVRTSKPSEAIGTAVNVSDRCIAEYTTNNGDPLLAQTQSIVNLIEEVITVKPRNSAVSLAWSSSVETACKDFFSPQHLRLFLDLYWALWHPNVNFMHRPTFDPSKAKTALVAAMAVIGACVSPDALYNETAKTWFNCVEEIVFSDEEFGGDSEGEASSHSFPSEHRLQSIQAAYMVCLFQNWEGSDQSKRRIRRFRYSTLVAVVRDTGIHHAHHQSPHWDCFLHFSWSDFVQREQLIRTYLWVFLLDTAFVIFNNAPPRMAIKELRMGFASNEAVFQAETKESCCEQLILCSDQSDKLVSSVTEKMCKGLLDATDHLLLADLGPLNLFTLTSAIHSLIFQFQQSFLDANSLSPIHNALGQWHEIWKIYTTRYASTPQHTPLGIGPVFEPHNIDNMWKRIGFSRFGKEYWLLAKMITARIESPLAPSKDLTAAPETAATDGILKKYDETSMQQVNELISEFQKVII